MIYLVGLYFWIGAASLLVLRHFVDQPLEIADAILWTVFWGPLVLLTAIVGVLFAFAWWIAFLVRLVRIRWSL